MIVIAHLSDIHIDGGQRSADRTRTVMHYLEDLPYDLDAVLVTGDIADHAAPAEYEQARQLLTSRHPVVVCPGNHDERAAFRQYLLGQPGSAAPINQVHYATGAVIALCDSSVPGQDEGFLEDETLAWLEDVMAQAPDRTPFFVGFHHPPAPLHIPLVDGIRQSGAERLAALTSRPSCAATRTRRRRPPSRDARCWWHREWSPQSGSPGNTTPIPRTMSISTSRRRSPSTPWMTRDG